MTASEYIGTMLLIVGFFLAPHSLKGLVRVLVCIGAGAVIIIMVLRSMGIFLF